MMYDKVRMYWGIEDVDSIIFPLDDNILASPYVVSSIDGLDPVAVNVVVGDKMFEGGIAQGRKPQNREITVNLSFQPDYTIGQTIGSLRTALYQMMTPKLGQTVRFYLMSNDESDWIRTEGYIKNIVANPFSKDPQEQIVLSCTQPYFEHGQYVQGNPQIFNGASVITMDNEGDAPTGFGLTFVLTAPMSSFYIRNVNDSQRFSLTHSFLAGDEIWIHTMHGDRYVTLVRGGTTTNILNKVAIGSDWIQLHGGLNKIYPSTINYTLKNLWFTSKRWGV